MHKQAQARFLVSAALKSFKSSWKSLFLTDIAFKIVSLIILMPLAGVLFRTAIAVSGKSVLSDVDILSFLLTPPGWLCIGVVASVWLGIVALEQAALLGIVGSKHVQGDLGPEAALRFAFGKGVAILRVTFRMVIITLLVMAPFLAAIGIAYISLLTEFDINYYLKEKPPYLITGQKLILEKTG